MLSVLRQLQQGGASWHWALSDMTLDWWAQRGLPPILMRNWLIFSLIFQESNMGLSSRYLLAQAVKSFLLDLGVNTVTEDYFGFYLQK